MPTGSNGSASFGVERLNPAGHVATAFGSNGDADEANAVLVQRWIVPLPSK
jgi:hypothetical protein